MPDLSPLLATWIRKPNIADDIDDDTLGKIADQVCRDFTTDKTSMEEWERFVEEGRRLAKQELTGKSEPWEKSANFKSSLLLQASIKFGDRANIALLKKKDLVKHDVIGEDEDHLKADRGKRVTVHMNYQLNYEMEEWRGDHDFLLYQVANEGVIFKDTFFDATMGQNKSELVKYPDFAVSQSTTNLKMVPFTRCLDIKESQVLENQAAGVWAKVDINVDRRTDAENDQKEAVTPERFLQQQCFFDLDKDGYEEPYLVVVHQVSKKVMRIVARYEAENIIVKRTIEVGVDEIITLQKEMERQTVQAVEDIEAEGLTLVRIDPVSSITKYGFIPDFIDGNYLNLGYIHLLGAVTQSINSSANHLLNSGTLANLQGGWLARGFRKLMGPIPFKPGHFEQTDIEASKLQTGILQHQFKEPSATLLLLNQSMTAEAKETVSITDLVSAVGANAPATTMLGMIQEQLMPVTALIMRLYRAEKEEFIKLYRLNSKFTDPETYALILDDDEVDFEADYELKTLDIMPAANPEFTSKIQNLIQSEILLEKSQEILALGGDPKAIMRSFIENIGEDPDEILPLESEEQEADRLQQLREQQKLQTDVIQKQLELAERQVVTLEQNRVIQLAKVKAEIAEILSRQILNLEKAETEETKNAITTYTAAVQGVERTIESFENEQNRQIPEGPGSPETQ